MSFVEMHFHTAQTSGCARVDAEAAVKAYKAAGYDAIVVTDHYYERFFAKHDAESNWDDAIEAWLAGWYAARRAGEENGIAVMLGMELKFNCSANDYLVYGITEKLLRENPMLYKLDESEFRTFADKHGLFFAQAHPFRDRMTRHAAEYLDGMEIANGNMRHNSRNDEAAAFAEEKGLIPLSGSDFHEWEDLTGFGIRFESGIRNSAELISALRSRKFKTVVPKK